MPDASDLTAVWADLERRWPENRIEPSLDRIAALTALLGEPQRTYPVIHVTGTNGKTSTARMIEALLRSFGLRTGLLTSPHLADPRERIVFDGEVIDAERALATWRDVEPYVALIDAQSAEVGGPALSFFETMTALAFAAFADAPIDVAVVEVGMGGAWDATNVADGVVAVVTPIGLDHRDYLGETVEEIAVEKAGIIKPGAIAVLSAQEPAVERVLLDRTVEMDATVAREGQQFGVLRRGVAVGGQVLVLRGLHGEYDEVFVPLFGEHQARNAALALAAAEAFLGGLGALDADLVRAGFASVTSPGRLEIVRRSPTVVLDAAHNPHGASALAAALTDSFDFTSLVAVVGMLADKDTVGIIEALAASVDRFVVTAPRSPRALPAEDLAAVVRDIVGDDRVVVEPDLVEALDRAAAQAEEAGEYGGAGVLVTGSVALVGQARTLLVGRGADR